MLKTIKVDDMLDFKIVIMIPTKRMELRVRNIFLIMVYDLKSLKDGLKEM